MFYKLLMLLRFIILQPLEISNFVFIILNFKEYCKTKKNKKKYVKPKQLCLYSYNIWHIDSITTYDFDKSYKTNKHLYLYNPCQFMTC